MSPVHSVGSEFCLPAGYALLNWFQGMVGAVLPAHERAKSGCAYGMLHQTFAPQDADFGFWLWVKTTGTILG